MGPPVGSPPPPHFTSSLLPSAPPPSKSARFCRLCVGPVPPPPPFPLPHKGKTMPASNLPEHRHARTGSLNIKPPHSSPPDGMMGPMPASNRFDGPRSPPSKSHPVPLVVAARSLCRRPSGHHPAIPCYRRHSLLLSGLLIDAPVARHLPRPMQILPAGRLPGWECMPLQPRPRSCCRERL